MATYLTDYKKYLKTHYYLVNTKSKKGTTGMEYDSSEPTYKNKKHNVILL